MSRFSGREWFTAVAGAVVFFAGAVTAGVLYALDALPIWAGWCLAVVAIVGLLMLMGASVRGLLRTDTEGVERQDAARASMIAVLVIVVAGFAYALLEAFAGLPRLTAAVPAALTAVVWMIAFAWNRRGGEEG